jgi:transcriptional regulator with XRE-family HTH domain
MKIKLFEEFIAESKADSLVNKILDNLEPTILEMVNETEKYYKEKYKMDFTDYERELTRLSVIYDMIRSIEMYTQPTDMLISVNPSRSRKGNIEISCKIQRGGEDYNLETEAIIAGGYNIQRAHYRYLTKTNLPKTGRSEAAAEYLAKIKGLSKAEKISTEIKALERDIERVDAKLAEYTGITDAQIAKILKDSKHYSYNNPSWEQIIKNNAAKNYNNSEEEYNASVEKNKASGIDFWKTQNIKWPTDRRKSLEKELAKQRTKLAAILP